MEKLVLRCIHVYLYTLSVQPAREDDCEGPDGSSRGSRPEQLLSRPPLAETRVPALPADSTVQSRVADLVIVRVVDPSQFGHNSFGVGDLQAECPRRGCSSAIRFTRWMKGDRVYSYEFRVATQSEI